MREREEASTPVAEGVRSVMFGIEPPKPPDGADGDESTLAVTVTYWTVVAVVVVVDIEHEASLLAVSTGRPEDGAATLPKSPASEEKPVEAASTGVDSGSG